MSMGIERLIFSLLNQNYNEPFFFRLAICSCPSMHQMFSLYTIVHAMISCFDRFLSLNVEFHLMLIFISF